MKRPHRFYIVLGSAFGDATTYSISCGAIRAKRCERTVSVATPGVNRWAEFWRLCDFLDVWNWRTHYDSTNLGAARNGDDWSVHIAYDGCRSVRSSGYSAFPSYEFVGQPSLTRDRLGLLLRFIDGLLLEEPNGEPLREAVLEITSGSVD